MRPTVTFLAAATLLAFVVATQPRSANAQVVPPCEQVVELAESLYEQTRYEEVITMVTDCIGDPNVTAHTAVRGYRVLALAFLRNDALDDARLAVIELLGRDAAYRADPVQDLPAYVALVNTTREQLNLRDEVDLPVVEPPVEENENVGLQDPIYIASRQPTFVRRGDMLLRARIGWSSYGGERGVNGGGFFGEFIDNGGESLSIELNYAASNFVWVGLDYQAARYPTLLDAKGPPSEDFPAIDVGSSSPWIHYVGILLRGTLPTNSLVKPYGSVGFYTSFGLINDKINVSGGPRIALGMDVVVGSGVGVFLEFDEQFLLPGDGSDLTDRQYPYDFFTGAAAGVRYTIRAAR